MAGKGRSRGTGGDRRANRGGGGAGGGRSRSRRPATNRQFPRTARLNTLLQEIVADFFERVDDERFEMLTVTGVEVDNDLNRAQVFVSALGSVPLSMSEEESTGDEATPGDTGNRDPDQELLDALADYRKPVRAKIGREARIRKTPDVVFVIDPAVRSGARIDQILAAMNPSDPGSSDDNSGIDSEPADESAAGHQAPENIPTEG